MMKDFKTGLRLMRYGYGLKSSILLMLVFLGIGVLMAVTGSSFTHKRGWMESFFILITALWPIQLLNSMGVSKMLLSSVWKKKLETTIPVAVNVAFQLLLYLLVLGLKAMQLGLGWRRAEEITYELLLDAFLILLIMVYTAIAYKLFILSTVLFMIAFFGFTTVSSLLFSADFYLEIPLWAAAGSGFLAILIGAVLEYAVSCLCYRLPFSKMAQMAGLRKYL